MMRYSKKSVAYFLVCCCLLAILAPWGAKAGDFPLPESYLPTLPEIDKHKRFFDDPRPLLEDFGPKEVLPPEIYERLSYDVEEMKKAWAEVVGFKAPDLVGEICPGIKPRTYNYKDVQRLPGFKELMSPPLYERIKPGGPPYAGNIPEFEIIPTRQYYLGLPVARKTREREGLTQLDNEGYLVVESWEGGYPFPRPTGKFKAQQIMYNFEKGYSKWYGNNCTMGRMRGFDETLKEDHSSTMRVYGLRLAGRVAMEPYGWFDSRAKEQGEFRAFLMQFLTPRDMSGAVQSCLYYLDPNKADQLMMYMPSVRRNRKLTGTDTQDAVANEDFTFDDLQGFSQKLSPNRYPYKYEVIAEREYLVRAPTLDGAPYVSSNGLELRGVKMERRPIYVLKLTQLDSNYVYSKRVFYVDKETFNFYQIENYDQKGRLYRTVEYNWSFVPEMGQIVDIGVTFLNTDHLEKHSSISLVYDLPAFCQRAHFGLKGIARSAK